MPSLPALPNTHPHHANANVKYPNPPSLSKSKYSNLDYHYPVHNIDIHNIDSTTSIPYSDIADNVDNTDNTVADKTTGIPTKPKTSLSPTMTILLPTDNDNRNGIDGNNVGVGAPTLIMDNNDDSMLDNELIDELLEMEKLQSQSQLSSKQDANSKLLTVGELPVIDEDNNDAFFDKKARN